MKIKNKKIKTPNFCTAPSCTRPLIGCPAQTRRPNFSVIAAQTRCWTPRQSRDDALLPSLPLHGAPPLSFPDSPPLPFPAAAPLPRRPYPPPALLPRRRHHGGPRRAAACRAGGSGARGRGVAARGAVVCAREGGAPVAAVRSVCGARRGDTAASVGPLREGFQGPLLPRAATDVRSRQWVPVLRPRDAGAGVSRRRVRAGAGHQRL